MKQLTEQVFEAMNTRDFELFDSLIADDVAFDFPGVGRVKGRRRTLLMLRSLLRKFPKLHFTVSEIIEDRDRSVAVWTNEGIDDKGNPYSNSGVTLLYSRGGKVTFLSDYFKDTSFVEKS
jgi:ketosteroid isomerase-like protein